MNEFYRKAKEAFSCYKCQMFDTHYIMRVEERFPFNCNQINFTPEHYLNFNIGRDRNMFKIENFVSELDDFLKANPCPCNNMSLKFKLLRNDRFTEYNCYGFAIMRSGIDDVGVQNIVIKDFNKSAIIDLIMRDVDKENFIHVVDIDTLFW